MTMQPPTELVFYDDLYRRTLDVWVDAYTTDERLGPCLVLGQTLCHPHGGGQKGDRATLRLTAEMARALGTGETLRIVDTRRAGEAVLHVLEAPLDEAAAAEHLVGTQPVTLELDWDFRYRQMRLHSTAHLLHCFVRQVLGREVPDPQVSDIQPDYGLNRYDTRELLDEAQLQEVVSRLNAFTAQGHPITTHPDPHKAGFRYWQCAEWTIPCGGTHPADTREIGPVGATLSLRKGRTGMIFRLADDA